MSRLCLSAYDLAGKWYSFDRIIEAQVRQSGSSPAVSFSARLLVDTFPEELLGMRLMLDGRVVFEGLSDRQSSTVDENGATLELEARSNGSYLLDNEALPATYTNVSLRELGRRYLTDYGIYRFGFNDRVNLRYFTVRKGLSDWEAVVKFCAQAFGRRPYLTADGELRLQPRNARRRTVSNTEDAALRFLSASRINDRSRIISKVLIRDKNGFYPTEVLNPQSEQFVVRRKRYYSPPSQYEGSHGQDARDILRRSMLEKDMVKIALADAPDVQVGDELRLRSPQLNTDYMTVIETVLRADRSGLRTEVELIDPQYVDCVY